jgi:beta-galactosidase
MRRTVTAILLLAVGGLGVSDGLALEKPLAARKVIRLDGDWQIAEGSVEATPKEFSHTVAVPGLVDMARPAFSEVGKKSARRQAFWYRRTFKVDGPVPEIAVLKLHKARYGTKVFLNRKVVGEHLPCFTPAYFDVRGRLKGDGQENELLIRVGADRDSMPQDMPTGWDFEKYLYIPGIYDSVDLILTAAPYIANVQIVPDVDAKAVRVVAEIRCQKPQAVAVSAVVVEAKSGKQAGAQRSGSEFPKGDGQQRIDLTIPIDGCRLWSPEDPFLYDVHLRTADGAKSGDGVSVRFGMRSFRFDPQSKRAVLNAKTYFMRGTNVCIYRFFEDAKRGDLPWRADWVRKLHEQFRWMHWNSIRYCIGFPPELWYDVADEVGFLIQDEFPIWTLDKAPTEKPVAGKIIPQYVEWMRERWNHPCVVIWDGQNESHTDQTGKSIQAVRKLDLSNRPWENGWETPQSPTDCVESHPYLFIRGWMGNDFFQLKELEKVPGLPALQPAQKRFDVPIIINEYCWLWLNRDGTPTCLTDRVYESILGKNSTTEQRRTIHARYVAALTEFWRCHRQCAGVLHFCGLGYSRPGDKPRPEGGATSDHWVDVDRLIYEPRIAEHVREAFNPVGLMLDFWADRVPAGCQRDMKTYVINDLETPWKGDVHLRVLRAGQVIGETSQPCTLPSFGRQILAFKLSLPGEPGDYLIQADLTDATGAKIRSLRDVRVTQ